MKKLILGILLLLLYIPPLDAQSSWSMGVGINPFLYWYYNRTDEMYLKQDFKIHYPDSFKPNGWQIGIPLQYQYSDRVFFQTALEWSTQQMSYEQMFPYSFEKNSLIVNSRMNYLKLPLLVGFKHNFTLTDHYLYGMIGPQLLFLTSYKSEHTSYIETSGRFQSVIEQNNRYSIKTTSLDGMIVLEQFNFRFN